MSKIATLGAEQHGKSTLVAAIDQRQKATGGTLAVVDDRNDTLGWAAAVLVISATDGPMPLTRDHVKMANHGRVPKLVVFINKADLIPKDDQELLDLMEMEARELLQKYGYNGDNAVVIRGSAQQALKGDAVAVRAIDALLAALR